MSFADELRGYSSVPSRASQLKQTAECLHQSIKENAKIAAIRGLRSISGFPANKQYDDYQFLNDSALKLFIGSDAERRAERNKQDKMYLNGVSKIGKTDREKLLPYYFITFESANDAQQVAEELLRLLRADGYTRYSANIVQVHEVIRIRKGGLMGDKLSYEETGRILYAVRVSVSW